MRRGRQSAVDASVIRLAATDDRPTLTPLRPLKSDEKRIFDLVALEHVHLKSIDVPLLMGFARASAAMFTANTAEEFEKVSRVALSFATKLRITPQSRVHPTSLGRRHAEQYSGPRPWDRDRDDDDEEDESDKQ
jgi:hypothetical protein